MRGLRFRLLGFAVQDLSAWVGVERRMTPSGLFSGCGVSSSNTTAENFQEVQKCTSLGIHGTEQLGFQCFIFQIRDGRYVLYMPECWSVLEVFESSGV